MRRKRDLCLPLLRRHAALRPRGLSRHLPGRRSSGSLLGHRWHQLGLRLCLRPAPTLLRPSPADLRRAALLRLLFIQSLLPRKLRTL